MQASNRRKCRFAVQGIATCASFVQVGGGGLSLAIGIADAIREMAAGSLSMHVGCIISFHSVRNAQKEVKIFFKPTKFLLR